MCQHIENDNIHDERTIPSENADLPTRMDWCYDQCLNEPSCTDFTVHSIGPRSHICYLLTNCNEKSTEPTCLAAKKCNSGPKDCNSNSNCEPLASPPPQDTIPWQCDHDVNPYDKQIPEGTECFINCNAWVDKDGSRATIVSKCVAGAWEASALQPALDLSENTALPDPLPKPDDLTQAPCGCTNFDMAWNNTQTQDIIDYDPNTLLGTDFICTGANYITDDGTDLKFVLRQGMTCRLFCDNYHIATMTCANAEWTGEPELGAWCYAEPVANDDMGQVTTTPASNNLA